MLFPSGAFAGTSDISSKNFFRDSLCLYFTKEHNEESGQKEASSSRGSTLRQGQSFSNPKAASHRLSCASLIRVKVAHSLYQVGSVTFKGHVYL